MNLSRGRAVWSRKKPGGWLRASGDRHTTDDTRSRAEILAESSDAELVRRMQADDLDAFEVFFARHRTLIFRTAYGLTGDRHAAEEVLQDTFARAYRHRAVLLPDVSPIPWLHRVALNLCYSRLDRRRLDAQPIGDAQAAHNEVEQRGPLTPARSSEVDHDAFASISSPPVGR